MTPLANAASSEVSCAWHQRPSRSASKSSSSESAAGAGAWGRWWVLSWAWALGAPGTVVAGTTAVYGDANDVTKLYHPADVVIADRCKDVVIADG